MFQKRKPWCSREESLLLVEFSREMLLLSPVLYPDSRPVNDSFCKCAHGENHVE